MERHAGSLPTLPSAHEGVHGRLGPRQRPHIAKRFGKRTRPVSLFVLFYLSLVARTPRGRARSPSSGCSAMAAEEVPVPPQYVPQPVTDFRGFEDGPRGYKVGVTKKGVLGQKRRLEEYEAQVRSRGAPATRRRGVMCSPVHPGAALPHHARLLNSARLLLSKQR